MRFLTSHVSTEILDPEAILVNPQQLVLTHQPPHDLMLDGWLASKAVMLQQKACCSKLSCCSRQLRHSSALSYQLVPSINQIQSGAYNFG